MINVHLELTRHSVKTGYIATCLYGDTTKAFYPLHSAPRAIFLKAEYLAHKAYISSSNSETIFYSYDTNKFIKFYELDGEHYAIAGCQYDVKTLISTLLSAFNNLDIEGNFLISVNGDTVACWETHQSSELTIDDWNRATTVMNQFDD